MNRSFLALILALAACSPGGGTNPDRDGGGVESDADVPRRDADGDGIDDSWEGRDLGTDTDGDGTPDYLDSDSDGDGIPDSVERTTGGGTTPPTDSDGDGTPDFQDTDSDGNGMLDVVEGTNDADGDGIPDYRDLDDDNDTVRDSAEIGDPASPVDTDGDGLPDFRDFDSDDDTIGDGFEANPPDTDGDGTPDRFDADSDGDGIPDLTEAGPADRDPTSPPVDTDMDGIYDFRDPDSDADGLSDLDERLAGTSPIDGDSDDDGISDLIESASGTDPLDPADNPLTRGDFVFVVPFMEDPTPERDTLEFKTNIQFADVYFLFDRTTSMDGEIAGLRTAVRSIVGNITCTDSGTACMATSECGGGQICSPFSNTCIEDPGIDGCLLSPWTGTGWYETNLRNLLSLQPSVAATETALNFTTSGGTENLFRALTDLASPGEGGSPANCAPAMAGFIGCPAFREEAVRIAVLFTDENSDAGSLDTAAARLMSAGITLIGVWNGTPGNSARNDLLNVVRNSGSLAGDGSPLLFEGQDASVAGAVEDAIDEVVNGVPLRVTIEATDEDGDAGDALQFIDYLEVNSSGGPCTAVTPLEDTDGDGRNDAFPAVRPGTSVCWDVVPARNETVMPELSPLVFRARLTVRGDGSPLDARTVYFLVPPRIELPDGPD
ncbi:MAG: hypothetical protein H6722_19030 [Sandaracinus sp.]|nr:hypothetical protein [Sandaracinus sp.]MCB9622944.1 hypothetical protein [Sandaracinus sp.]